MSDEMGNDEHLDTLLMHHLWSHIGEKFNHDPPDERPTDRDVKIGQRIAEQLPAWKPLVGSHGKWRIKNNK